ncbi:restriction endonuclease subunit S [Psychrobacter sanguinis]|uniref:restriction endonuclease subunit S n=1 Tax=Psychrobacter sanguinis TaxID=861445 RepID=UPI00020C7A8A|nr:restriction endonuclease subunit S [Psychrobacter sanguinis]EGK12694.1 restriction endonuclease S subunit [Psychrobacter sp. 1501(2011)]MCD9151818.1 restriction endonuclease subunit S [Psychrobacter sanguinis]
MNVEMSKDIHKPEQLITEHIDIWTSAILAKSTSGRGSSKKYELYGITKLRGLIFDLAVRGKLVPQDLDDEPASKLIERVVTRKFSEITENEKIFTLPLGWSWIKLEDIAEINGGFAFKSSDYTSDGIRVIRISDFNEMGFKSDKVVRYPYSLDLERYRLEENNILMAMTGGTVGKSLLVQALPEPMIVNQRVATIKLIQGINSTYINSLIRSELIQSVINEAKNSTNDNISMKSIKNFLIPLPPFAEQKRIVAKVDELMLLCDQLEQQTETSIDAHATLVEVLLSTLTDSADADELAQNWARIAEHFDSLFTTEQSIKSLKQTVLQLAVMGKLVPQNPDDEPASVLLERINEVKSKLVKEEGLRTSASKELNADDKYLTQPHGWEWMRLGNLAKFIDYRGKTPTKIENGVRLITAKNIRYGYVDLKPEEFISEDEYTSWMTRGFPKQGDTLFTPEAPLGNAANIDIKGKFALAQRAICFQWHISEISDFLLLQILAQPFQLQLIDNATGMTATGIKASKLKEIPMIIPPLAEQHRIVTKVDELMAICDQLKARLQQSQETQVQLTDALIDKALG